MTAEILKLPTRGAGIQPGVEHFDPYGMLTDKKAVEVFANSVTQGLAYFVPGAGWTIWNGRHWESSAKATVTQMALELGSQFRATAASFTGPDAPEIAKKVFRFAQYLDSDRGVRGVLNLAKSVLEKNLAEFDTDPWLFNCQNGTLDLRTGELREHSMPDYITKIAPVEYVPGRSAPRWDRFLERIMPDAADRAFLQRAVGYALTGSTRERKLFILYGSGRNGKSVCLNTIAGVIGGYYAQFAQPETFMMENRMGIREDVACLRGVRYLVSMEASEGQRLNESLVKHLTGGDAIRARHLYQSSFEFTPEFKLFLGTNHRPTVRDTSEGMWDRLCLIPFTERIPDDEVNRDLAQQLLLERVGIFAWAVQGASEYLKTGLGVSENVKAATTEYRASEDIVAAFVNDRCTLGTGHSVLAKPLLEAFQGHTGWQVSPKRFATLMDELARRDGFTSIDHIHTRGGKLFMGIGLQP